jgi:DNA polymerase
MNLITVDFESYYSKEFGFSKMTTEEYVRHPDFEVIGVGIKENDGETEWFSGDALQTLGFLMQYDWQNSFVLAHNTAFDGAILSWLFGIKAKGWLDTLSMARAIHGVSVGGSLAKLATHYEVGEKGNEVVDALGLRRKEFAPAQLAQYGEYCKNDVQLCYDIFHLMMAQGFPKLELKVIDATLKMFVEPVLELDLPLLEQHLEEVQERKERLLKAAEEIGRAHF